MSSESVEIESADVVSDVVEQTVESKTAVEAQASTEACDGFGSLGLPKPVMDALKKSGYETPSPIQAQTIPYLLEGRDVLGQAQTGTGKTAAFALPLLARLDPEVRQPQVLVLAPTRELAIQVSEAFERYAACMKDVRVLPVYGGQDFYVQKRALDRGVHIVVGTPGRVIDQMKRGVLKLDALKTVVLDEADEMLRMGFIDDVEWVLSQTSDKRQTALFSATMPEPIRRITQRHLREPAEVTIREKTRTATTVTHRRLIVHGRDKSEVLCRLLETEKTDGVIVFVRTKNATAEVADELTAQGFQAAPLNGDMPQNLRERTVDQLKAGKLNILVATDVAARGLDVNRVSHVVNYDLPQDTESYIHRIGRTGRAGRSGQAILFVKPQERKMLWAIERATRQKIESMEIPTADEINAARIERFKQRITDTLEAGNLEFFRNLIEEYQRETSTAPWDVAAALAKLLQGDVPLLMKDRPLRQYSDRPQRDRSHDKRRNGQKGFDRRGEGAPHRVKRPTAPPQAGMERFRLEVGSSHGVRPGNIVGAIANEAGIESSNIGRIEIYDDFSTVDLPADMPLATHETLKKTRVSGRPLQLSKHDGSVGRRSFAGRGQAQGGGGYSKGKRSKFPSGKHAAGQRAKSGPPRKAKRNRAS